jgi:hypothetical protein
VYLRFVAAILALTAGVAGVVVAVMLLRSVPGPTSQTSAASSTPAAAGEPAAPAHTPSIPGGRIPTPTEPGFPSPPPGALVLAREAGKDALALAVKPGLVRVSVVGPEGTGVSGLRISLQFGGGYFITPDACGKGCYQAETSGHPDSPVTVRIGDAAYRFELPRLPAPDGSEAVERTETTWNALRTLVWHERLGSSPTDVIRVVYTAVAPHSLSYTVAGGSAAVIIGGTRWDRPAESAPWRRSIQNPPVRQPQPFWRAVADARVVRADRPGPRATQRVSFFDPSTPAWFEASIDRQTHRTLVLKMIAAAHFMHDVYGPFDAPIRIVPPT